MLSRLSLILRTLSYLRWQQLVYRPIRLAQFRAYRAMPFLTKRWTASDKAVAEIPTSTLSLIRQVFDTQFAHWAVPLREVESRLTELKAGRFTLLNQTRELPELDWNARYVSHLWNYQLHYQDAVVWLARAFVEGDDAIAWQRGRSLVASWITQARIGVSDGWDAYPTSLRIVHWIYAYVLVAGRETDELFLSNWRASIFCQLDFLSCHLEKHLLANHLFKNVKALVIGGLFFAEDERGQRWLREGERLLARELEEQVLPDGGHYERAPMYHAQTLGDALECYALLRACGRDSADEAMRQRLLRMADFLAAMSYADGSLALFNDSANTFESRPQPLLESARRVCGKRANNLPTSFPDNGYYLWQSVDEREKLIVDAGEPSVSYNTAHAHCDMLSYELRLNGEPFIVDSGVHGYGGDEFREYCRSTRAHNAVMVDNIEQSEVWGTFRMARRAQVLTAAVEGGALTWRFEGEARSYGANGWRHLRRIQRAADGSWEITDRLLTANIKSDEQKASSFIHLHPAVKATKESGAIICQTPTGEVLIEPFGCAEVELVTGAPPPAAQGWHFPEFGTAIPGTTVVLRRMLEKSVDAHTFGYRIKRR